MSDSLWPHGLQSARLLCPWDFPGKNTGVGCHFLLQGIFLTQESNPRLLCLLHQQTDSLPRRHLGSPSKSWLQTQYLPQEMEVLFFFFLIGPGSTVCASEVPAIGLGFYPHSSQTWRPSWGVWLLRHPRSMSSLLLCTCPLASGPSEMCVQGPPRNTWASPYFQHFWMENRTLMALVLIQKWGQVSHQQEANIFWCFFTRTIFKVFIEFVIILFLFCVLIFWPQGI